MSEPVSFHDEGSLKYLFVDWAELGETATDLAEKILKKGLKFDRLIALATGGHTMSKAMKDYLLIPKISSLQISFYTGIGKTKETPVITQSLPTNVNGENVLIFDDVNDSGATMETASAYLKMCGASDITTATLYTKKITKYPSDFYGHEVTDWIVFPDEIRETIVLLTNKWEISGLSKSEINSRLKKIGFTDRQIALVQGNP